MDLIANEREAALLAFAAEAQEILARMEGAIAALEVRPGDDETLDVIVESVVRLVGAAARASFHAVRELTLDLAALLERLRALSAPIAPEHLRLLQRTLVTLAESTADGVAGVSAPRPEVAALREQLAVAASPPIGDAPANGHGSVDLALQSVVAGTAFEVDAGPAEAPATRS